MNAKPSTMGRMLVLLPIVLALGLLVLALSSLEPNRSLGLLLSATMLTCYATTLLLLPALLKAGLGFPPTGQYAGSMAKDQNRKGSAKQNKPKLSAKEKKAKKLAKKAKAGG